MAATSETSLLVGNGEDEYEPVYLNMGYGAVDGDRRASIASSSPDDGLFLTVDEFMYRVKYVAQDKSYNVEPDIKAVLQTCTEEDIARLLQELNSIPLKIQQKLKICKILHSEGYLKKRYKTGTTNKLEKKRGMQMLQTFSLWEDTIAKLTAYFGSNVSSYFRFVRSIVYMNVATALLLVGFITVPKIVDGSFKSDITFGGHFGELSDSIMFYGLYTNDLTFTYNLPVAYFLTWVTVNLMCFIYIITLMIVRYRKSKLLTDQGSEYKFAWRTFCTWDFSITSRQGVIDHRTSLRTDLKEIIREEQATSKVNIWKRVQWYVGRLVSNVIVIGILVGSGLLIYTVAERDIVSDSAPESVKEFFRKYQLTGVVAGLKFLVPPLFQQLVRLEGWHPRTETKFTLARTTIFYIASLMVFVLSLYKVTESEDCFVLTGNTTSNTTGCCWENDVGEEVFKVILLDFGILIAVGIVIHMGRAVMVKYCRIQFGYSKFDVVACVLDVIYGQSLVWLGLYFSPLLGLVGFLKLVFVFYVRLIIAKVAMVPPQQLFRASSTGNFYLAILLLNLFVSLFPMAYAVIEVTPSTYCGPFIGQERSYRVISNVIGDLPNWLEDILVYISTPAIMVPFLILLILSTIFFNVKFSSYKSLTEELRKQLIFIINHYLSLRREIPDKWYIHRVDSFSSMERVRDFVASNMNGSVMILFPLHTENHWSLLVFKTKEIAINILDPVSSAKVEAKVKQFLSLFKSADPLWKLANKQERRVEKRKIFATGKAMSAGGTVSRYTSQESLISNITQQGGKYHQPPDDTITEEHGM